MKVEIRDRISVASFRCMASPCEILLDTTDTDLAEDLAQLAVAEASRIEAKFSRYLNDNIVHRINHGQGKTVAIDPETSQLLNFADQCFTLSEGLFDITSGVLRRVWTFDGGNKLPAQSEIDSVMPLIGWDKVKLKDTSIDLPRGMEIDLGGIGKEYAVDRVLQLLQAHSDISIMVNFGGDCHANYPPKANDAWLTGIENPHESGDASEVLLLKKGGLATSGNAYRFIEIDGHRYGHILNPQTGWPVSKPPLSVTVAAGTCTEAGILATLAMLQGEEAEAFLQSQEVQFWCLR